MRRALFADSIDSSEKVREKLREKVLKEIPVLPVTNPVISSQSENPPIPWSVPKSEARLIAAAQEKEKERIERRKIFHRNCVPVEKLAVMRNQVGKKWDEYIVENSSETRTISDPLEFSPDDPTRGDEGIVSPVEKKSEEIDQLYKPNRSGKITEDIVEPPYQRVPHRSERNAKLTVEKPRALEKGTAEGQSDIKELEKLIQDTHDLLEQEGFSYHETNNSEQLSEDLVAELEREIDELTKSIDLRKPPRKHLQLENELDKLIKENNF